jgi:hypothetical protein
MAILLLMVYGLLRIYFGSAIDPESIRFVSGADALCIRDEHVLDP